MGRRTQSDRALTEEFNGELLNHGEVRRYYIARTKLCEPSVAPCEIIKSALTYVRNK